MRKQLLDLREKMKAYGMDAYIVRTDDFHSSEYVGEYFKCRKYVSGFTGSAGTLVVTDDFAGVWTDGRYFLQAAKQLEGTGITLCKMGEPETLDIPEFLKRNLGEHPCVGFDGRCISCSFYESLVDALASKQASFVSDKDLVGMIWENRPGLPMAPVWELSEEYTGESRAARLQKLRDHMTEAGATMHLLSSLDDICWLYNLRGSDVACNPVPLCYTLIAREKATLYICIEAVPAALAKRLQADGIELKPYNDIYGELTQVAAEETVLLSKSSTNMALLKAIPEACKVLNQVNPTTLMKGVKTAKEQENTKLAHIKDGVALTKLLHYLKCEMLQSDAFKNGQITELSVAARLEELRKEQTDYLYQSFTPIIATGAHGAIIHYDPTPETDAPIEKDTFLLMDTGGQYLQGTTDVTRTVAVGSVTDEMKLHFTLVLKGHLNLCDVVFKEGMCGQSLDYVAREPLHRYGLDYNHGTGHGVGYLLNVHEGPQNIRSKISDVVPYPMKEGMITSDEPGLYLAGKYGIRTENLMLCIPKMETEYGKFLGFSHLTLVPYDVDALLPELLTAKEKELLNQYHALVYDTLKDLLTETEASWLYTVTRPI